jgi:hypothetical protein
MLESLIKGSIMRSDFTMTLNGEPPLGDYLLFKIADATEKKQGRITLTALAILSKGSGMTDEQVFNANRAVIREAIVKKLRTTVEHEAVFIDSADF